MGSRAQRQRLNPRIEERRKRVVRAVDAIAAHPTNAGNGAGGVLAFHVRYFGIPECVKDVSIDSIARDLRWLRDHDLVSAEEYGRGFAARVEYAVTDAGREWAKA